MVFERKTQEKEGGASLLTEIGHARPADGILVAEQDGVADDGGDGGADDEGRAAVQLLRHDGHDDGQDGGERVGRDGQQLRARGRVAEALDDGGQEERERVERQRERVEGQAVQPALGVAQARQHACPREGLGGGGVRVARQPRFDVGALLGREEGRGRGVVGDEPVGEDGDDDGEEAFDDEDPAPAFEAADAGHFADALWGGILLTLRIMCGLDWLRDIEKWPRRMGALGRNGERHT